jgi:hypothetical protein
MIAPKIPLYPASWYARKVSFPHPKVEVNKLNELRGAEMPKSGV